MTQEQIQETLSLHLKWLNDEDGGKRADLSGADLSGAEGIMTFGPMPTSGRMIYFVWRETKWMCQAGCFWAI